MKNTGTILILRDIYQNIYIPNVDKYKLFNAMFDDDVRNIEQLIRPLALIYRSNAFHIKKYRIDCIAKLEYSVLSNIFEIEEGELDSLALGRLLFETFEYIDLAKKHIKTKYNASYYSLYISQIKLFDKKKARLNVVRKKRQEARAKVSNRPNAYGRLAKDNRIKKFNKDNVSNEYLDQAKINFAMFWKIAPMEKKNKASCRRLFISDTKLNDVNNFHRLKMNMTIYRANYDFTNTNTFDFLLDEDKLKKVYQETFYERKEREKVFAKGWLPTA